jgi:predicted nucleotidyltransferase
MVQIPTHIREIIEQYITALKIHIPIQQVVLFGSYARGNAQAWSDVDLAVVSADFVGIRLWDRKKIRPITLSVSSNIEVFPYHPNDFTTTDPFVAEILKTGITFEDAD